MEHSRLIRLFSGFCCLCLFGVVMSRDFFLVPSIIILFMLCDVIDIISYSITIIEIIRHLLSLIISSAVKFFYLLLRFFLSHQ